MVEHCSQTKRCLKLISSKCKCQVTEKEGSDAHDKDMPHQVVTRIVAMIHISARFHLLRRVSR